MSHQTPAPRVPAGVTTGGQFTATARGESDVELATENRADRQARVAAAMREAAALAESYGAADLRGVQVRAALAVNLTDYATEVRTIQDTQAWQDGDVDTDELLTRGLLLLEETGAHEDFVSRVRRVRRDPDHLDGDVIPTNLVDEMAARVERHQRLDDAVLHSPLAGSTELALSRLHTTGDGRNQLVLNHTEFVAAAGGKQNVCAILTPAGTVELWAGGQRVVGLGEHLTLSKVVNGTGVRATDAPDALAGILLATC
ncbi:hypothetical protein [Cellulosimicrobium sp. Marseille-Q4280]|uniref:hypothetical protein n=1 Tax=Cellulosimicrobium sp. Marseille-Q4280 TaxID=2937992 RepID=UPI00203EB525|nr:hypothetical protein [Cellulosimicrobium sp. Marseille-Q4280]